MQEILQHVKTVSEPVLITSKPEYKYQVNTIMGNYPFKTISEARFFANHANRLESLVSFKNHNGTKMTL